VITPPRFTPSLLDGDTLEQLFVAREADLDRAVARIADAANRSVLKHTMFVGPRGAGKTHLISLIKHRASRMPGHGKRFAISWLEEDPYSVFDFDSFVAAIDANRDAPPAAAPALTIVLAENFDRILDRLGEEGQRRLRARIERRSDLLLVVTAVRPNRRHLSAQSAPLYGFFDITELPPFTLGQAIAMLKRSAAVDGDEALARRLDEPPTRARLAAIQQLAGGQPRMWATFSAGLTIDRVGDLPSILITQFDELKPYYQQQLDRLSTNELKAVLTLLDADRAMTVTEISAATGIDKHSLAPTLRGLVPHWLEQRTGYLMQFVDGRRQYYQLAEPMARVFHQVNRAKGTPIRMVVDFLTAWYSRDEISRSADSQGVAGAELEAVEPTNPLDDAPIAAGLAAAAVAGSAKGGYARWQAYKDAAREQIGSPEYRVRDLAGPGMLTIEQAESHPPGIDNEVVGQCQRIDDALTSLQRHGTAAAILELPTSLAALVETRLETLTVELLRLEIALVAVRAGADSAWLARAEDAITGVDARNARLASLFLACVRLLLGLEEAALGGMESLLGQGEALSDREWNLVATTITCDSRPLHPLVGAKAMAVAIPRLTQDQLLDLTAKFITWFEGHDEACRLIASGIARRLGAHADSPAGLRPVLAGRVTPSDPRWTRFRHLLAWWRSAQGDPARALEEMNELLSEITAQDYDVALLLELRADREQARAELTEAQAEDAAAELRRIVGEATRVLGESHAWTLMFRRNLAHVLFKTGPPDIAVAAYDAVIADETRHFGPRHPRVAASARSLAFEAAQAGLWEEAARRYEWAARLERGMWGSDALRYNTSWRAAHAYAQAGLGERGIGVLRQLLADRVEALGEGDELALGTRRHLAAALAGANRPAEAAAEYRALLDATARPSDDVAWRDLEGLIVQSGLTGRPEDKAEATARLALEIARQWGTDLATAEFPKQPERKPGLDISAYLRARGYHRHLFSLNRDWLATVGLADLPVGAGSRFRRMIYRRLEQMVGAGLTANCPEALLDEFGHFVDKRHSEMVAWLEEHIPGFPEEPSFQALASENPGASRDDLLSEFGALEWLRLNRPDYRQVVRDTLDQIEAAVREAAPEILAAASSQR
jgi:hypothetical protein